MISFNEYIILNEILKYNGKVSVISNTDMSFNASFSANGILWEVRCDKNNDEWHLRFFDPKSDKKFDRVGSSNSSSQIFGGVIESVLIFIDLHSDATLIYFKSAYKELDELYKSMGYLLKRKYPDWKYEHKNGKYILTKR